MRKLKKIPAIILTATIAAAAAAAGIHIYASHSKADEEAESSLSLTVLNDSVSYSADTSFDPLSLVKAEGADKIVCNPENINPNEIGAWKVVYTLTDPQGRTKDIPETITVKDEQPPEISFSTDSVSVIAGTEFDPQPFIAEVKDPVDGDLVRVDEQPAERQNTTGPLYDTGWYMIGSNVDMNTPGDYTFSVHASDRNGNTADASLPVHVEESQEEQENPVQSQNTAASVTDNGAAYTSGGDTGNETLNTMCDTVLSSIIDASMDDYSKCYAIYSWVENNIYYTGGSDHSSWVSGAITALSTRRGDCYAFFSSGMALLTRAGFTCRQANMGDGHYWVQVLYNDQWLNWDATTGWGSERFLWTDDQLRDYSYYNPVTGMTVSYGSYFN